METHKHKNEMEVYEIHPHFVIFFNIFLLTIVAFFFGAFIQSLALMTISFFIFIFLIFLTRAYSYRLSEEEVIASFNFISRKKDIVPYSNIQNISVRQGVLERVFGVGDIHIDNAGTHGEKIILLAVPHPDFFEKEIRKRMKKNSF